MQEVCQVDEAGYGGYRTKIGNTENGYIPHTILPIIYKLNTPKE